MSSRSGSSSAGTTPVRCPRNVNANQVVRALARAVEGISDSVLSDRLGALTRAGLVVRTVSEGPPVSVDYDLTDAGRALLPALEQISGWAQDHLVAADRAT